MSTREEDRLTQAMHEAVAHVSADSDRLLTRTREQGQIRLRRRLAVQLAATGVAVVLAIAGGGALAGRLTPQPVTPAVSLTPAPQFNKPPPTLATEDGELLLACYWGAAWKASVTEDGLPGVDRTQFVPALEAILNEPMTERPQELVDGPSLQDAPWRVLAVTDRQATLAVGDTLPLWTIGLERHGAEPWYVTASSPCVPQPALPSQELTWVQVSSSPRPLAPDRPEEAPQPLPPNTRDIQVWVNDLCSAERDLRSALHEPVVVETADSVTVYWAADYPVGIVDCYGFQPVAVTLHLSAPLGDRPLLDGSTWPPVRVGS